MSGTKVSIKYGFGKPQAGSLKKAELAIDLKDLSLWTTESDGGQAVRVAHDTTELEGQVEQINIDIQLNTDAINQLNQDAVKKNVSALQEMIGKLKAVGFIGNGSELTGITANQLDDVDTSSVKRDDFLIYSGTNWVAESFHIDTELTYQGGRALASPAPSGPANGDLYINNADGIVHPTWTGISGQSVKAGNVVGWASNKGRWFLLGDIASSSVTAIGAGLAISVDDSTPAKPVVSVDRVETNKWYEPKFSKNTAFNKAFGTAAGTVAQGNHVHNEYIAQVTSVNGKKGAVVLTHTDVGAAPASHAHSYVPLSGNSQITGVLTATDFTITSDERLKGEVETLDPSKVYEMRGVSYTHLESGEQSSGVIAQELQKVAPELVLEDDGGYLSVAYPKLVGYLIETAKSQKSEIDELRKAIEDMR
jgi:hypothetical protein